MKPRDIRVIDKLLESTREPLSNILLYAEVGMAKMRQDSLAITEHRYAHDTVVIDALKKAQKELEVD